MENNKQSRFKREVNTDIDNLDKEVVKEYLKEVLKKVKIQKNQFIDIFLMKIKRL